MKRSKTIVDATIENHGSICIVQPHSAVAHQWIADSVGEEAQYWAGGLVVEPRYLSALVAGMRENGLTVR